MSIDLVSKIQFWARLVNSTSLLLVNINCKLLLSRYLLVQSYWRRFKLLIRSIRPTAVSQKCSLMDWGKYMLFTSRCSEGVGHCPAAWASPPPPLSLSTSLAAARPQDAVKWLLLWLNRIWKRKKKTLSHPLFVLFFVSVSLSFGHMVLTLTENRPEDVDFKRNKVT